MGTSYDGLMAAADRIYEKAVEEHLSYQYGIYKDRDGRFYDSWNYGHHDYYDPNSMARQEQLLQERVDEAAAEFDDVPTIFSRFSAMPDPSGFDGPITSAKSAMGLLSVGGEGLNDPITGDLFPFNTALKDMTSAAGYLEEWDGLAMMEFRENFINKFSERTLNQFTAACVVKNALDAEKALWHAARANICEVADDTLAALDHMHDCGKNEWTTAFGVVGAVATVGGLLVATGGTAAIALGAVAAASSLGGTVAGTIDDPPKPKFAGESPVAVINQMRDACSQLEEHIETAETKIKTACTNAKGTLESRSVDYVAPRPELLDGAPDVGRPDAL